MRIEWRDRLNNNRLYIDGYVGDWRLFTIYYDETDFRGNAKNKPWSVSCSLPGVKAHQGRFEDKTTAIRESKKTLKLWLDKLHKNGKKGGAHAKHKGKAVEDRGSAVGKSQGIFFD